jgi:hypothetical protein
MTMDIGGLWCICTYIIGEMREKGIMMNVFLWWKEWKKWSSTQPLACTHPI